MAYQRLELRETARFVGALGDRFVGLWREVRVGQRRIDAAILLRGHRILAVEVKGGNRDTLAGGAQVAAVADLLRIYLRDRLQPGAEFDLEVLPVLLNGTGRLLLLNAHGAPIASFDTNVGEEVVRFLGMLDESAHGADRPDAGLLDDPVYRSLSELSGTALPEDPLLLEGEEGLEWFTHLRGGSYVTDLLQTELQSRFPGRRCRTRVYLNPLSFEPSRLVFEVDSRLDRKSTV